MTGLAKTTSRTFLRVAVIFLLSMFFAGIKDDAFASPSQKPVISTQRVQVLNNYRSPKNPQRPVRKMTRYIILHTTEGAARGALNKLSANGECHYVVNTDGKVYTIIDRSRVAYHAGLSMWNGQTGLDSISVGIEIVGYHNKKPNQAQYTALKLLVSELKAFYKVPDERVLTHSMVAYGNPNRWHKRRHRGRKRCAMIFGLPDVRAQIGLYKKPSFDPDVRAGRLADADPELTKILYKKGQSLSPPAKDNQNVIAPGKTAWDIARDLYRSKDTVYIFPDGKRKNGDEIKNWKSIPAGTRVEIGGTSENLLEGLLTIGVDGSASELGGDEITASTTFYFKPDNSKFIEGSSLSLAEIDALPEGTKMLVGYKVGGPISAKNPVFNICSVKWNSPDTFYLDRNGKLTAGDSIDEKNIAVGTMIFYR